MTYLLDADVFIRAKNLHYGFDFCPGFWDWLVTANERGRVFSIEKVGDELNAGGGDELAEWTSERGDDFFLPPNPEVLVALGTVGNWVNRQSYEPTAINTILQVADFYLISQALAGGHAVVTHEIPSPSKKRIKIPKRLHRPWCQVSDSIRNVAPRTDAIRAGSPIVTGESAFIDNRDGNTLARALGAVLGVGVGAESDETSETPGQVRIATAFFSPTGFAHIVDQLATVPDVRLMLGADLAAGTQIDRKRLDETRSSFERRRIETGLRSMADGLERERDHLPFTRTNGAALASLIAALRAGNMEVRRYEKAFLHAKAYIFTPVDGTHGKPEGIIAGSSNLTGAGLKQNLELNLGRFDRPIVEEATQWFDDLWDDAEPYDLAGIFEVVFQPRSPWDIFIRVLWQLYGDEVQEEAKADGDLPLTSFQKHGVARALRLIRETGGVIVADEVGLGKTFIGGEILQIYRGLRQRALLICPAALRDSTWKSFSDRIRALC